MYHIPKSKILKSSSLYTVKKENVMPNGDGGLDWYDQVTVL